MAWEIAHQHRAVYGASGKSSEQSVWDQHFRTEQALAAGEHTASVLLDLEACYEMLTHGVLWAEAVELGFNLTVLWLAICQYTGPRVVNLGGQDMVLSALKTNRQSMARAGALDVERPVCPLRTGLIWRGSGDKVAWIERPAQRV